MLKNVMIKMLGSSLTNSELSSSSSSWVSFSFSLSSYIPLIVKTIDAPAESYIFKVLCTTKRMNAFQKILFLIFVKKAWAFLLFWSRQAKATTIKVRASRRTKKKSMMPRLSRMLADPRDAYSFSVWAVPSVSFFAPWSAKSCNSLLKDPIPSSSPEQSWISASQKSLFSSPSAD